MGEEFYFAVLIAASVCALTSAVGVTVMVMLQSETLAWIWTLSFVLSAVVAALCLARLL